MENKINTEIWFNNAAQQTQQIFDNLKTTTNTLNSLVAEFGGDKELYEKLIKLNALNGEINEMLVDLQKNPQQQNKEKEMENTNMNQTMNLEERKALEHSVQSLLKDTGYETSVCIIQRKDESNDNYNAVSIEFTADNGTNWGICECSVGTPKEVFDEFMLTLAHHPNSLNRWKLGLYGNIVKTLIEHELRDLDYMLCRDELCYLGYTSTGEEKVELETLCNVNDITGLELKTDEADITMVVIKFKEDNDIVIHEYGWSRSK